VRIQRMAEALVQLGHDVHVAAYSLGDLEFIAPFPVHRIARLPLYRTVRPGPTYTKLLVLDVLLALEVLRLTRRVPFDILHAHHYEGLLAAWPAHRVSGIPLIFDSHTLLESELPYYGLYLPGRLKRNLGIWLDGTLPGLANRIICASQQIQDAYIRRFPARQADISLIPGGVEAESFNPNHHPESPPLPGRVVLGYAGGAGPYQGLGLMFEAVTLLTDDFPGLRLHISTSDSFDDYASWMAHPALKGRVHLFPSSFSALPAQLAEADILLSPRRQGDGYPQKLLNYMAAGKPVVCFRAAGQDLRHGETGWLVDQPTAEAFAGGIRSLLLDADLRRRLGKNARRLVEQEFGWQKTATQVDALYRSLTPGRTA
jgi:glycosyltransferase involved in cell wall biosynthesis